MENETEILIAVYGSLRKGQFNFERHGKQRFVTHDVVENYVVNERSYFPQCYRGPGAASVEVHAVSPETFKAIEAMEAEPFNGGRHYFPVQVITASGHRCVMWEYRE